MLDIPVSCRAIMARSQKPAAVTRNGHAPDLILMSIEPADFSRGVLPTPYPCFTDSWRLQAWGLANN